MGPTGRDFGSLHMGKLVGRAPHVCRVSGVHPLLLLPLEVLGFGPNSQACGTGWRYGQRVPRSGTARPRPSLLLSGAPRRRLRGSPEDPVPEEGIAAHGCPSPSLCGDAEPAVEGLLLLGPVQNFPLPVTSASVPGRLHIVPSVP